MRVKVTQPAPPGARFSAESGDDQVGRAFLLHYGDTDVLAVVVGAEVALDGSSCELTLEVPDNLVDPPVTL